MNSAGVALVAPCVSLNAVADAAPLPLAQRPFRYANGKAVLLSGYPVVGGSAVDAGQRKRIRCCPSGAVRGPAARSATTFCPGAGSAGKSPAPWCAGRQETWKCGAVFRLLFYMASSALVHHCGTPPHRSTDVVSRLIDTPLMMPSWTDCTIW